MLDKRRNKQISVPAFPELFAPVDVLCVLSRREQRCCLPVKSAAGLTPAAWSPRRPASIPGWLLVSSTQQLCLPQTRLQIVSALQGERAIGWLPLCLKKPLRATRRDSDSAGEYSISVVSARVRNSGRSQNPT